MLSLVVGDRYLIIPGLREALVGSEAGCLMHVGGRWWHLWVGFVYHSWQDNVLQNVWFWGNWELDMLDLHHECCTSGLADLRVNWLACILYVEIGILLAQVALATNFCET